MFLLKFMVTLSRVFSLSMHGDIVTYICKHMIIEPYDALIYHWEYQKSSNIICVGILIEYIHVTTCCDDNSVIYV